MAILPLVLRTVLIYFVVFLGMRIMGKREIGKLSVFDLVISVMMAEIAVFVLEDIRKPLTDGLIPILVLVMIQVGTAYWSLKSKKIRDLLDGKPSYLIRDGSIDREEMRKQRYNLDDLMVQLRQNRVLNVADVEFAVLETSGKLTVVEKDKKRQDDPPPDPFDTVRYEGLPLPLIMDGKVQDENLVKLGKTRFWLKNQIQQKGAREFKEVFFCSIDHKGRMYMDKKQG